MRVAVVEHSSLAQNIVEHTFIAVHMMVTGQGAVIDGKGGYAHAKFIAERSMPQGTSSPRGGLGFFEEAKES